ncbi:MAG: cupin domain-containing protein, partial [Planctomycetota bacterium]|nr:cupin domain-containing protein [Planctomycetota bacterium]
MSEFPEIPATPNVPVKSGDLEWEDYSTDSVRFGDKTLPLGDYGGATQLGFNLVELPPGKQSCPFHYHMKEEEHYYILEGRCILRSGDDRHEMKAGD